MKLHNEPAYTFIGANAKLPVVYLMDWSDTFVRKPFIYIALVMLLIAGCGSEDSSGAQGSKKQIELVVSASASLNESLKEIALAYEAEHPEVQVLLNLAGSGTLQQQIEQGAQVDLFVSAGLQQMNALITEGLIDPEYHTTLLSNELVVITRADTNMRLHEMSDLASSGYRKLAIGEPQTVPAGEYAKQSLSYHKLWDELEPRYVLAKDVRQVLTYVDTGNAEIGFVYKTDAMTSDKVKVALVVDPQSYSPIQYPMGIVKGTKNKEEAEAFYHYLLTEAAQERFKAYGFTAPQP